MTPFGRDQQIHFAIVAYRESLLTADRFAAACQEWYDNPSLSLPDLVVRKGWLSAHDRERLERLTGLAGASTTDEDSRPPSSREEFTTPYVPPLSGVTGGRVSALAPGTRYRRVKLHARGGSGDVWLAQDEDLCREVALKELQPGRSGHPAVTERFLREARITGQLEHPGIVPVYELVRDGDSGSFYVMRFIKGRTLAEAAAAYHRKRAAGQEGPLDLRELLQAFVAICNAVAYAHSRGVIHRDLKGNNVVLGDFGEVIVLDWGLARKAEPAAEDDTFVPSASATADPMETGEGQILGTPAFMAPEQAEGDQSLVDARTDVYGLGAVLYQILTGQAPFRGPDLSSVLHQVREGSPRPPREINPAVPPPLQAVCRKAMERRKEDRYARAADLAQDVRHWLADEPVSAYPEPAVQRLGRWSRRHRTAVAAAAALLFAADAGLGVTTALVAREQSRTDAARQEAQENYETAEQQRLLAEANAKLAQKQTLLADQKRREADDNAREADRRKVQAETSAKEARRQEEVAVRQQVRAEGNFRKALEAVDKLLSRVGAERLRHVPQMEKIRKELLEEALAFYQDFLQEREGDQAVKLETARAYCRVANIRQLMGQHQEAVAACREGVRLFKELSGTGQGNERHRHQLALAHLDAGRLLELQEQFGDAAEHAERGAALLEKLVKDDADNADLQRSLSNGYSLRGSIHQIQGQVPQALAAYRLAETIRQKLYGRFKDEDPTCSALLAGTHYNYGNLHSAERRYPEAEKAYRKALDLQRRLVKLHPGVHDYQDMLATTLLNLGNVLQYTDRLSEAEKCFREVIALTEPLIEDFPGFADYHFKLATCQGNLGNLRYQEHKLPEAEQFYLRALTHLRRLVADYPTSRPEHLGSLAEIRMNYANVLHHTGRLAEAERIFLAMRHRFDNESPPAKSPDVWRRHNGICHCNLGYLFAEQGRQRSAEYQFRKALEMQKALEEKDPDGRVYRQDIASTYNRLGNLLQDTGRFAEARTCFEESVRRLEKLTREYPRGPENHQALGAVYYNLGNLHTQVRSLRDAEGLYQKALKIQKSLVETFPGHQGYRADLAGTHLNLGNVFQDTARYREAEKAFLTAAALLEKLLKETSDARDNQRRLGMTYYNLGNLHYESGGRREDPLRVAEGWYRKALQVQTTLVAKGGYQDRDNLAGTHLNLGNVFQYTGRYREAEKAFDAAAELSERLSKDQPGDVMNLRRLGIAQANRGNLFGHQSRYRESKEAYLAAIKVQERLARLPAHPRSREFRFDLASTYNNLAMLLSDCPDEKLRDLKAGLEAAEKAVKLAPGAGHTWNTAGISRFRVEDWKGSRAAFERSVQLRGGGDSNDWYFLAVICWKEGDRTKARDWFSKAKQWREKNAKDDPGLLRYEAEARKVIEGKP